MMFVNKAGDWEMVPFELGAILVPNFGQFEAAEEVYCVEVDQFGSLFWRQAWSSLETPSLALDGVTALTVTISWGAITGATAYTVYRTTSNVVVPQESDIVTTSATSPYVATVPTPSTSYYFWVRATKSTVRSLFSNRVTGTTVALPTVPQSFAGTGTGDSGLQDYEGDLTWDNAERAEEKTLEVFNRSTSAWVVLDSDIGEADTQYLHNFGQADWDDYANLSDEIEYRIKFNSESTFATTTVSFVVT